MEKRIIEGALHIVEKQGVKFTMDELASELGMSKKTIYTVFRDKNELLIAMVDYVFDILRKAKLWSWRISTYPSYRRFARS